MTVAAGVHIALSKFFPDHNSLVADAVLADDVLAGLVPGYEHLAERSRQHQSTDSASEDKMDTFEPKVQQVV